MELVNLKELIKYHPYHISTFANFANVTVDLLEAALNGEEELTGEEIRQIARLMKVKPSILMCPKLILLDQDNYRHHQMMREICEKTMYILKTGLAGSRAAKEFESYKAYSICELLKDFTENRPVSYCRYLAEKERVEQGILSIMAEEERLRPKRGRTKINVSI